MKKSIGLLVSVSLTYYYAYTPDLSTWQSSTTLIGKIHLKVSFPLRCFQRLCFQKKIHAMLLMSTKTFQLSTLKRPGAVYLSPTSTSAPGETWFTDVGIPVHFSLSLLTPIAVSAGGQARVEYLIPFCLHSHFPQMRNNHT